MLQGRWLSLPPDLRGSSRSVKTCTRLYTSLAAVSGLCSSSSGLAYSLSSISACLWLQEPITSVPFAVRHSLEGRSLTISPFACCAWKTECQVSSQAVLPAAQLRTSHRLDKFLGLREIEKHVCTLSSLVAALGLCSTWRRATAAQKILKLSELFTTVFRCAK